MTILVRQRQPQVHGCKWEKYMRKTQKNVIVALHVLDLERVQGGGGQRLHYSYYARLLRLKTLNYSAIITLQKWQRFILNLCHTTVRIALFFLDLFNSCTAVHTPCKQYHPWG